MAYELRVNYEMVTKLLPNLAAMYKLIVKLINRQK